MNARLPRPEVLGARLRTARTAARLTQDAAAKQLGHARTTIVAIEAGKRALSSQELRAFAQLYGARESELLSAPSVSLDMDVQFRSQVEKSSDDEELRAISMIHRLAEGAIQLEAILGVPRVTQSLPLMDLMPGGDLDSQAEDAAVSVRQRMGLGVSPLQNLVALLEAEFGLNIFERRLPSKISGAVAYDSRYGGFILLNANHAEGRRRLTAAHEFAHLIIRTSNLRVHFESSATTAEDRFCDLFSRAFLMPAAAVRRRFNEILAIGQFSFRHLIAMAVYFDVSVEAMARRLESLRLVAKGSAESLRDLGLGHAHVKRVMQELGQGERTGFTPRTYLLAGQAYDKELLSEQQLSTLLQLDLLSVRKMLSETSDTWNAAGDPT